MGGRGAWPGGHRRQGVTLFPTNYTGLVRGWSAVQQPHCLHNFSSSWRDGAFIEADSV